MIEQVLSRYADVWAHSFELRFINYWLAALALALLARVVVGVRPRMRVQPQWPPLRDYAIHALYCLRAVFVKTCLGALIFLLVINGMIDIDHPADPIPVMVLQFLFLLALQDTYTYWLHRMLHTPWFFKHFHYVHHEVRNPTPFASLQMAVGEVLMVHIFYVPALLLFPFHVTVFSAAYVCAIACGLLQHAGVEFQPRAVTRNPRLDILCLGLHHDYHHRRNINRNYGFYFLFWDKVMKTFAPPPEKAPL